MSDRLDFDFDSMRGVSVPRSLISLPDFPIPGMKMPTARSTISSAASASGMSVATTKGRYLEVSRRTSQATSIANSEVYSAFVETGPAPSVMSEVPPSERSSFTKFSRRKIPVTKNQFPNVAIRNINLNPPDINPNPPSSVLVPYYNSLATHSNLAPLIEEQKFDYPNPELQHAIVERSSSLPRMKPGQLPPIQPNYILPSKKSYQSEKLYIPDHNLNLGRNEKPQNRQSNMNRRSSSQKITSYKTKAIQDLAPKPRSKEGMVRRAFYRKESFADNQSIIATKKDFKHRPEFYVPPPTAKRKQPPTKIKRKLNNNLIDEYSPLAFKSNIMRPLTSQQSRAVPVFGQLTPVASRSLLTCNNDFRQCYPQVYQGICKGVIDVDRLIVNEVVIPIREEVSIHKSALRSRRAVVSIVSEQLWKPLHGKFPDPQIAPRLVKRVAEYFHDKIEAGVENAEDERSLFQWLFRFDIENAIEIKVTTSLAYGVNSVISNIEGSAHIKRKKGDFMGLWSKDNLLIDLEVVVKAVFLNGGQLSELDSDPMFADRVQCGGNRMLGQYLTE
eukprot:GHVP01003685.1.p1 GENE.GHVP01003685.1~~GHVP01003685.1.p1  ORF type:complete len:558 (+),score=91.78 GHVP01003685.1:151-1824(+)